MPPIFLKAWQFWFPAHKMSCPRLGDCPQAQQLRCGVGHGSGLGDRLPGPEALWVGPSWTPHPLAGSHGPGRSPEGQGPARRGGIGFSLGEGVLGLWSEVSQGWAFLSQLLAQTFPSGLEVCSPPACTRAKGGGPAA